MAIVVMEEMLGGLDEVKEALDRAITVLTDLVEECDPALVPHLPEMLDRTLLQPLTAHSAAVEHLLATLAQRCSSPGAGSEVAVTRGGQRTSRASLRLLSADASGGGPPLGSAHLWVRQPQPAWVQTLVQTRLRLVG